VVKAEATAAEATAQAEDKFNIHMMQRRHNYEDYLYRTKGQSHYHLYLCY